MTRKLYRYIFDNFLLALSYFGFAFVGMFWLGQSVGLIEQIVLRGEGATTFFLLSIYLLPAIFLNVLPISTLGAALYFLNNLATRGELATINTAGLAPISILRPIALLGAFVTVFLLILSLYIAPKASYELRTNLKEIELNFENNFILSGRFIYPLKGVTVFSESSLNSGEMINIFIEDRREPHVIGSYYADRGLIRRDENTFHFALIDGEYHEYDQKSGNVSFTHFDRTELNLPLEPQEPPRINYWRNEKPTKLLIAEVRANPFENSKSLGELANRIFYPFLGLILPSLAGLTFAGTAYSRRGYTNPILFATTLGIIATAIQMGAPSNIEKNPLMLWMEFVPFFILLATYFYMKAKIR